MPFVVRELFPTLQGEGSRTGSPAIFVRLAGCNLWSGIARLRDSGTGDCAGWCDTDFASGEKVEVHSLLARIRGMAKEEGMVRPLVVFTGGEPLLQMRTRVEEATTLLTALLREGMETALETNGTQPMPRELAPLWSHVTVSPKGLRASPGSVAHLHPLAATDLKVVVPCPMALEDLLPIYRRAILYLQPRDDGDQGLSSLAEARRLAALHGGRVSIQTHKLLGLP